MAAVTSARSSVALSVDHAWNAVALEERLELLSRAHAHGILAGVASILLLGTIAYGFDEIYILAGGFLAAFFMVPMFMSYSWRRGKPAMILAYLAVRTVARRYAYGYNLSDLDIVLIYRGTMTEIYHDREEEELIRQRQQVDFTSTVESEKAVWICLLRGAVVILSEREGGAKLEFLSPITNEVVVRRRRPDEDVSDAAMVIEGAAGAKGKIIALDSRSTGAQYVFERQLGRLIAEYKPPVSPYYTARTDE
ncbi:MAG: hypothetical protein U0136_00060 [Bdellovibrionota bacterium]